MVSFARVPSLCATCQLEGALEIRQVTAQGRLGWTEHFSCACGHGFEARGEGVPPPLLRRALLAQLGRAEVWLEGPSGPYVVFDGTAVEAAHLCLALQRQGDRGRVLAYLP